MSRIDYTKIEIFNQKKEIANKLELTERQVMRTGTFKDDGGDLTVKFEKLESSSSKMITSIGAYFSRGSLNSVELGSYLAKSIEKNKGVILRTAIEMAQADAERARKDAENEALLVLGRLKEVNG